MTDMPGKNMLFDDETVRHLYAEEDDGEDVKSVSVSSLLPAIPKAELNPIFTKVVTDIANTDPTIRRLAQQLSDEVEGLGQVSALILLAECGMMMNEIVKGKR